MPTACVLAWLTCKQLTNNPKSACAMHILNNQHEYGPINSAMDLLKPCAKGKRLNSWKNYYIQEYQMKGQLVGEQNAQEVNALFQLAQMHTLHNGTIRRDSTPGHASMQAVGIT
jgi:hypothetical protein